MAAFSPDNLLDILELIDLIAVQTSGMSKADFLTNPDVQDATAYRILAIGEVCRLLPEDLKTRHAHIAWHQIAGMRNILAHEYFSRESAIIWDTTRISLPELADMCQIELKRLEF